MHTFAKTKKKNYWFVSNSSQMPTQTTATVQREIFAFAQNLYLSVMDKSRLATKSINLESNK